MTTKQINGGNIMINENKKSIVIYQCYILFISNFQKKHGKTN